MINRCSVLIPSKHRPPICSRTPKGIPACNTKRKLGIYQNQMTSSSKHSSNVLLDVTNCRFKREKPKVLFSNVMVNNGVQEVDSRNDSEVGQGVGTLHGERTSQMANNCVLQPINITHRDFNKRKQSERIMNRKIKCTLVISYFRSFENRCIKVYFPIESYEG